MLLSVLVQVESGKSQLFKHLLGQEEINNHSVLVSLTLVMLFLQDYFWLSCFSYHFSGQFCLQLYSVQQELSTDVKGVFCPDNDGHFFIFSRVSRTCIFIYNNNHDLRSCNSSSLHSSREKSKETCKVKNAEILCYILNNNLKLLNEQWNQLFCCICCKF